jgi:hypothetical protein
MKKRLNNWNGRHLSIGGRVSLINSVLSSLPLYFFSFFKAPVCVLKEMVSIQRNFLWGGGMEGNKMCWVSWDRICQPKEKGGLGIKNMELFDSSLLCKWKWRCLEDRMAPWYGLLRFRYGSLVANFLYNEGNEGLNRASIWWRDIWRLGSVLEGGWFSSNIRSKIGNGNDIAFWKDRWLGSTPLCEMFPDLFTKTMHPANSVMAMGFWNRDSWEWNFEWAVALTATEHDLVRDLSLLLEQVQPRIGDDDRRRWLPHEAGFFTVKSAYVARLDSLVMPAIDPGTVQALKHLWLNNVPSKVSIFGWRLLLERLPTRDALFNKGVITNNLEKSCAFCSNMDETLHHCFLGCHFIATVWRDVYHWMGISHLSASNVQQHFIVFGDIIKGKKCKKVKQLIWLATMWSIWRSRNNILFRGDVVNIITLVDQIKYISWFWLIGRVTHNANFSYAAWCINPLHCLQSI